MQPRTQAAVLLGSSHAVLCPQPSSWAACSWRWALCKIEFYLVSTPSWHPACCSCCRVAGAAPGRSCASGHRRSGEEPRPCLPLAAAAARMGSVSSTSSTMATVVRRAPAL